MHEYEPIPEILTIHRHSMLGLVYRQPNGDVIRVSECLCGPFYTRLCPVEMHKMRALAEDANYRYENWIERQRKRRRYLRKRKP